MIRLGYLFLFYSSFSFAFYVDGYGSGASQDEACSSTAVIVESTVGVQTFWNAESWATRSDGSAGWCTVKKLWGSGYALVLSLPIFTSPVSTCMEPAGESHILHVTVTELPAVVCDGSCEYEVSSSVCDSVGICRAVGVTTGLGCSVQTADSDVPQNDCIPGSLLCNPDPISDPDVPPGCYLTADGLTVCPPEPTDNPDCITVNGKPVCGSDRQNCVADGGAVICNLGLSADMSTGSLPSSDSGVSSSCIQTAAGFICLDNVIQEDTALSTVTNTDGSTTTTIKTDSNIQGSGVRTEVVTVNTNGTSTKSVFSAGSPAGDVVDQSVNSGSSGGFYSGGDCSSVPVCDGDPVLCAVASHVWQQKCDNRGLWGSSSQPSRSDIHGLIMDGDVYDNSSTDISISGLQTNRFVLTGSCPPPKSYSVLNTNISIDYSIFCSLAEIIGVFVVIGSSLIALRMVV